MDTLQSDQHADRGEPRASVLAPHADQDHSRASHLALHAVQDGIYITDADGRITMVNAALCASTGYSEAEILGRTCAFLHGPGTEPRTIEAIGLAAGKRAKFHGEILNYRKDGTSFWSDLSITPVPDKHGAVVHFIGLARDITERKQLREQMRQLAFHDALTGLCNRNLFDDRLGQALAAGKRSGCYGAVLFIDQDNFKPLNDRHGHAAGDALLIETARRLKACIRESDTAARFGGDEFVVLLNEFSPDQAWSTAQALVVAEKIRAALLEPYALTVRHAGQPDDVVLHHATASIGVAMFLEQADGRESILKRADMAMYQAKRHGGGVIRFDESKVFTLDVSSGAA